MPKKKRRTKVSKRAITRKSGSVRNEKSEQDRILTSALSLIREGFHVVPSHRAINGRCTCGRGANCESPGKHPATKRGVNDATAVPDAVFDWFDRPGRVRNISIATGATSGVLVLDVDERNGGFESLAELVKRVPEIEETLRINSGGGGRHYYFLIDPSSRSIKSTVLAPGIDILSDGKLAVAPPSVHPSGERYEVDGGGQVTRDRMVLLPDALRIEILSARKPRAASPSLSRDGSVPAGSRNNHLFEAGCALRRRGYETDEIQARLKEMNADLCKPPLKDSEVEDIAKSASKSFEGESAPSEPDPHLLATRLLTRDFSIGGVRSLHHLRGALWKHDGTRYQPVGRQDVEPLVGKRLRLLLDHLGKPVRQTKRLTGDVVAALRSECLLSSATIMPCWLTATPPVQDKAMVVPAANGLLEVSGDGEVVELHPHSAEFFSSRCASCDYVEQSGHPTWTDFLRRVLPEEESRAMLQEFFGYTLTDSTRYQKFLLMVGSGANGKSVVSHVWRAMLGAENTSSIGLDRFGGNFALAGMVNKAANICAEMGKPRKGAEDVIKAIVAGDSVPVEAKFKDVEDIVATVKLIFATNELPEFVDRSDGLWRRLLVLMFPVKIPESEQELDLHRRIIDHELEGVLCWAVRGLCRLLKRGHFTETEESKKIADDMKRDANIVGEFLRAQFECKRDDSMPVEEAYRLYTRDCERRGLEPLGKAQFGIEVQREFPEVRRRQERRTKGRIYTYFGLGVKVRARRNY